MRRLGLRRGGVGCALVALLAGAGVLLPATAAWAPHVPQLNVTPMRVPPGGQATVLGTRGYGFTNPVEIHLDSVNGPVLGSFQPDKQAYAAWGPGTITIPADTTPGNHVLYATQLLAEIEKHIRGIPALATIEVIGEGGAPVVGAQLTRPGEEGSAQLVRKEAPSSLALIVAGLGVAGIGTFAAGMVALRAGRRRAATFETNR